MNKITYAIKRRAVPYGYKPFQHIPLGNGSLNTEFEKECPKCGKKFLLKGFSKTEVVNCTHCAIPLQFTLKELTKECDNCGCNYFNVRIVKSEWSIIKCKKCGLIIQRLSDAIKGDKGDE